MADTLWTWSKDELLAEVRRLRELEKWLIDCHNNGNKLYVQEPNGGALHEITLKVPYPHSLDGDAT